LDKNRQALKRKTLLFRNTTFPQSPFTHCMLSCQSWRPSNLQSVYYF